MFCRQFVRISFFFNTLTKALTSHISRKENSFAFKLSILCKQQTLIFLKRAVFFTQFWTFFAIQFYDWPLNICLSFLEQCFRIHKCNGICTLYVTLHSIWPNFSCFWKNINTILPFTWIYIIAWPSMHFPSL